MSVHVRGVPCLAGCHQCEHFSLVKIKEEKTDQSDDETATSNVLSVADYLPTVSEKLHNYTNHVTVTIIIIIIKKDLLAIH